MIVPCATIEAMNKTAKQFVIEGHDVYDIVTFAAIVGKKRHTIYSYMHVGNKIRKLKYIMVGTRPYVLASELEDYPFTKMGPNSEKRVMHYNTANQRFEYCKACSEQGQDAHGK